MKCKDTSFDLKMPRFTISIVIAEWKFIGCMVTQKSCQRPQLLT